jgi:hypothetical protein
MKIKLEVEVDLVLTIAEPLRLGAGDKVAIKDGKIIGVVRTNATPKPIIDPASRSKAITAKLETFGISWGLILLALSEYPSGASTATLKKALNIPAAEPENILSRALDCLKRAGKIKNLSETRIATWVLAEPLNQS